MNKFEYMQAHTPEEAVSLLAARPNSRLLAGGTDLLTLMKDDLVSPRTVIDLSPWKGGKEIVATSEGTRIGALATLSSIAENSEIKERLGALAQACALAASPQLRNMGTLGGNLLQQTRCWYYRGPFDCWLKGGQTCFARNGENEQHAIFDTAESPCVSAHPSDPAAALLALDAVVEYVSPGGAGQVALSDFFVLPSANRRRFTALPKDAVITAITVPGTLPEQRSTYVKAMPRAAWSFALAGVALRLGVSNGRIVDAGIALSGVAPIPHRARNTELLLAGNVISTKLIEQAASELTASSAPLSINGYKTELVQALFREAIGRLT